MRALSNSKIFDDFHSKFFCFSCSLENNTPEFRIAIFYFRINSCVETSFESWETQLCAPKMSIFARQQPLTNFKIWVPCGKPLKNTTFLFWCVIWVPQGIVMVPKIFSRESLILQISNDVSHVFFELLEQKLFRKTKGRQINSQGCTDSLMIVKMIAQSILFFEMYSWQRLCRCYH